jgi:hypothetical protein
LEDVQFFPQLGLLNDCAARNNVDLRVTDSFRPINGNIGVPNSDHLAGHAIDVRVPDTSIPGGFWPPSPPGGSYPLTSNTAPQPGSKLYNEMVAIPATAQAVIQCATKQLDTPYLRWGGTYAGVAQAGWDPVHFGDELHKIDLEEYFARQDAVQSDWTNVLKPNNIPRCCGGPSGG